MLKNSNRRIWVLITVLAFVVLLGSALFGCVTFSAYMHNKRALAYAEGNWVLAENLFARELRNNTTYIFGLYELAVPSSEGELKTGYHKISVPFGRPLEGVNHFISVNDTILTQYACYLAVVGDVSASRSLINSLMSKPAEQWYPHVDLQSWCMAYLDGDESHGADVESAAQECADRMTKYGIQHRKRPVNSVRESQQGQTNHPGR